MALNVSLYLVFQSQTNYYTVIFVQVFEAYIEPEMDTSDWDATPLLSEEERVRFQLQYSLLLTVRNIQEYIRIKSYRLLFYV